MVYIHKCRGTYDIYGEDIKYWNFIEEKIRTITNNYNYKEIRTPIFEMYELFKRGTGNSTDIVQKELYDFHDKSGRHIALKPESTAPVVRCCLENKLFNNLNSYLKFYYISPHFRYERQQKGRYRQHHQFGVEVFGKKNIIIDLEVISMAVVFLKSIGLNKIKIFLNNLGTFDIREKYKNEIKEYFLKNTNCLCELCNKRIYSNPLRILDCKIDSNKDVVKKSPSIIDFLGIDAINDLKILKNNLEKNFDVKVEFNNQLVRGLDYYTGIVFEIIVDDYEMKNLSVCGGGRYDKLISELGGDFNLSGIGFGIGIERLILSLKQNKDIIFKTKEKKVYIADITSSSNNFLFFEIVILFRKKYNTDINYEKKSIKYIMKFVNKNHYTDLIIIGDDELKNGYITYKNLLTRETYKLNKKELINEFNIV